MLLALSRGDPLPEPCGTLKDVIMELRIFFKVCRRKHHLPLAEQGTGMIPIVKSHQSPWPLHGSVQEAGMA